MKLESLDLNLLLVFEALVAERNVTRAAERVGLTQPAVSNALARLREVTRDRLFERVGGSMQPTPYARQLVGPVGEALARLRAAFESTQTFDPAAARDEFRIAASDYMEALIVSQLAGRLTKSAPGVSIRTIRPPFLFEPPEAMLESGDADLAVGLFPAAPRPGDILDATLFYERFVCVVRARHPKVRRRLDFDTFVALPHIRVLYPPGQRDGHLDVLLRARGHSRHVAVTVAHLLSVPEIAAASDLVGIIPERLALAAARRLALRVLPLPIELPVYTARLLWHERNRFDVAHAWLREQIEAVAAQTAKLP